MTCGYCRAGLALLRCVGASLETQRSLEAKGWRTLRAPRYHGARVLAVHVGLALYVDNSIMNPHDRGVHRYRDTRM